MEVLYSQIEPPEEQDELTSLDYAVGTLEAVSRSYTNPEHADEIVFLDLSPTPIDLTEYDSNWEMIDVDGDLRSDFETRENIISLICGVIRYQIEKNLGNTDVADAFYESQAQTIEKEISEALEDGIYENNLNFSRNVCQSVIEKIKGEISLWQLQARQLLRSGSSEGTSQTVLLN